jgi:hypothetical protein
MGERERRRDERRRWMVALPVGAAVLALGIAALPVTMAPPPMARSAPLAADGALAGAATTPSSIEQAAATEREPDAAAPPDDGPADGIVTIQVCSVSPKLLPHLRVIAQDAAQYATLQPSVGPGKQPDAAGRVQFAVPAERFVVCLRVDDGWRCLVRDRQIVHTRTRGVLELTPADPIVGVFVVEHDQLVRSAMGLTGLVDAPQPQERLADCHVLLRAPLLAAPTLWTWTMDAGPCSCAQSELRIEDDCVFVEGARPLARLRVRADVPREYDNALRVMAEPLPDGMPVVFRIHRRDEGFFESLLPPQTWRVRWSVSSVPGPVIADDVLLAPGETREVLATVPVLQRWNVRIDDQAAFGPQGRFALPRVRGHFAMGPTPVGSSGTVPILLPDPPHPGDAATIYLHLLKVDVPARVAAIDPDKRTFALEHDIHAADVVHLHAGGLADLRPQIWLRSQCKDTPIPAWLDTDVTVPMLQGSTRTGCVVETIPSGGRQVTNWFTVTPGTRELQLQPCGHWTTVRVERPIERAQVRVEGWPGMNPVDVRTLKEPGECPVFVADGLRGVHVDLTPGGRVTFAPPFTDMVVR